MTPQIRTAVAALLLCAAAATGCGVGEGPDEGRAELTISRGHGSEILLREGAEIGESETVIRLLDREAEIETRYGGGFVQSIDGLSGGTEGGRRSDWFFYVNGIESPLGSAEYALSDGDRVWWDYRDWSTAMRVPAVVGSWPEPFVHGFEGDRYGTRVVCRGATAPCAGVGRAVEEAGAELEEAGGEEGSRDGVARILVGPWDQVRSDSVAGLLRGGPSRSGVYATFAGSAPSVGLVLMDERARVAETLGRGAGLVAALRPGEEPPTWIVTGTDAAGVAAAAELLGDPLTDTFAVAAEENGETVPLPVRGAVGTSPGEAP